MYFKRSHLTGHHVHKGILRDAVFEVMGPWWGFVLNC